MRFGRRFGIIFTLVLSMVFPFAAPADSFDPIFSPSNNLKNLALSPSSQDPHYFFTIAQDANQVGPIYPFRTGDMAQTQDYVTKIFRHIVFKADQVIHDNSLLGYRQGSANQMYYAFLMLALAVPHHESRLVHFREADAGRCFDRANKLMNQPVSARRVLSTIYRNPISPIIPDCRFFSSDDKVNQLVTSSTGDTGIMQVNARYHAPAYEPSMMLNVYRSIDYGIDYIYTGFEELSANMSKFSCSMYSNPFEGYKNSKANSSLNLMRAVWGGRYNSRSVCRFTGANENDKNFMATIKSLVIDDNSMYHYYLPEGSIEKKALLEIVANFRSAYSTRKVREQNENLFKMLGQSEILATWQGPRRLQQDPTHLIRKGQINLQSAMDDSVDYTCGYLIGTGAGEKIQVLSLVTDASGQKWSEVYVPAYTTFSVMNIGDEVARCNTHNRYYVHSSDVKRLSFEMVKGKHYRAVIIGVGHNNTNVHLSPSVSATIVDVLRPGRRVEITETSTSASGEEWCRIVPGDSSYMDAWIRCEKHRVAPVSELKSEKGA